jgi:carboxylesterase type B
VRDVFARISEFGGDNKRVGVAGDSAGGWRQPLPSPAATPENISQRNCLSIP